ncbi:Undecaprenyl-diphosphatase [Candidatus Syntrophocurvum alkaliphilum]|uniref:Undecaprenyl-diphosphatase n=1 Tax=Candidatus Syntrophocurvum alkaliphilum TaxID=2293317 RepID=A0A6I6DFN2_9FIRM|nr:undecaprenyl-diphosphatase UppP [Candidatus Syntrophocurvum alkaliphilum]QGU00836.1 Undecaprenyl-diphosphatase [Candidatus Syntrophocurvum alkaliphilum]
MTYIEAIIFGIVQGITEFLPISSTAHIIITEHLLGYHFPGLTFEIYLHLASVLAVIIYFRKDLINVVTGFFAYLINKSANHRTQFMFGIYILIATIITGTLGIVLKGVIQDAMKTPTFIGVSLMITGTFLIIIERFRQYGERRIENMTYLDSIIVGLGQTLAVLPGISRSGSTLVTGLWVGLSRDTAVRYSFLLAIPVILGSSVLVIGDLSNEMWSVIGLGPLIVSFVVTFIFSWIGIVWLIDFLKRSKLIYFAIYCFTVAILLILFMDPNVVMDI